MSRIWAHQKFLCKPLFKDPEEERMKSQCRGKVKHLTFEKAENEAFRLTAKYRNNKVIVPYYCEYCEGFHTGGKIYYTDK